MTAFKSLLYREFQLSKKNNIFRIILIIVYSGLMWATVFSTNMVMQDNSVELAEVNATTTISTIGIMISLVSTIACLTMDNIFKSDLVSGWLKYSYTLPITPFMRAAVRTVRQFIMTALGTIIYIVNMLGLCATNDISFSLKYITLQFFVIDLTIIIMLLTNLFTLSARDIQSLKKKESFVGVFTVILAIVATLLICKIKDIKLSDITGEGNFNIGKVIMSKLSGTNMFIISLVIMLILIAIDMAVVAYRLRSAEVSHALAQENIPIQSANEALKKSHISSGFIYKELTQNKTLILFIILLPLGFIPLRFLMSVFIQSSGIFSGDFWKIATGNAMRYITYGFGAVIASNIIPSVFQGDDKKLWAYFTVSTPVGIKGFMYAKYMLAFAMNGLYMISYYFSDTFVATLKYAVTGKESTNIMSAFILVFYLMLFLCAFDIPFSVRYGAKKGSIIKITLLMTLTISLSIGFVFLPENISDKILKFCLNMHNGKAGDITMLIMAIGPFVALTAYAASYKLSCKLFLKGANEYDK